MRGSSLSRGLRVDGLGGTLSADDGRATSFEAHPESLIFRDGMIARKAERFYWFSSSSAKRAAPSLVSRVGGFSSNLRLMAVCAMFVKKWARVVC